VEAMDERQSTSTDMIEYLLWKNLIYIIWIWVTIEHWGQPHGF